MGHTEGRRIHTNTPTVRGIEAREKGEEGNGWSETDRNSGTKTNQAMEHNEGRWLDTNTTTMGE